MIESTHPCNTCGYLCDADHNTCYTCRQKQNKKINRWILVFALILVIICMLAGSAWGCKNPWPDTIGVTGTKYQPVEAQCDSTPLNTADGSYIDTVALAEGDIRWCAISQDLLWFKGGPYHFGDTLVVISEDPAMLGEWIIHDTMNARHRRRIDFLQWFDSNIHGQNPGLYIYEK